MGASLRAVSADDELERQYQGAVDALYENPVRAFDVRKWPEQKVRNRLKWALASVSLLRELLVRRSDWKVFVGKHMGNFEEHVNMLYAELDRRTEIRHRQVLQRIGRALMVLVIGSALLSSAGFMPVDSIKHWAKPWLQATWKTIRP